MGKNDIIKLGLSILLGCSSVLAMENSRPSVRDLKSRIEEKVKMEQEDEARNSQIREGRRNLRRGTTNLENPVEKGLQPSRDLRSEAPISEDHDMFQRPEKKDLSQQAVNAPRKLQDSLPRVLPRRQRAQSDQMKNEFSPETSPAYLELQRLLSDLENSNFEDYEYMSGTGKSAASSEEGNTTSSNERLHKKASSALNLYHSYRKELSGSGKGKGKEKEIVSGEENNNPEYQNGYMMGSLESLQMVAVYLMESLQRQYYSILDRTVKNMKIVEKPEGYTDSYLSPKDLKMHLSDVQEAISSVMNQPKGFKHYLSMVEANGEYDPTLYLKAFGGIMELYELTKLNMIRQLESLRLTLGDQNEKMMQYKQSQNSPESTKKKKGLFKKAK